MDNIQNTNVNVYLYQNQKKKPFTRKKLIFRILFYFLISGVSIPVSIRLIIYNTPKEGAKVKPTQSVNDKGTLTNNYQKYINDHTVHDTKILKENKSKIPAELDTSRILMKEGPETSVNADKIIIGATNPTLKDSSTLNITFNQTFYE